MLGKMIKHEFKATSRLYLPLFVITLVLTPILALLLRVASDVGKNSIIGSIITGVSIFGIIIMLIALSVASVLFVVIRFYKTIATSEAYLTFCLPVKPGNILLSKLLVGVVWEVSAVIVTFLSLIILFTIQGSSVVSDIMNAFDKVTPLITAEYGSVILFWIHICVVMLISTVAGTLAFFLAICLGQLFNEHRVITSIVMYVAVYTVGQIVSLISMLPLMLIGNSKLKIGEASFGEASFVNYDLDGIPAFWVFFMVMVLEIVLAAAYYVVSTIIIKKKINVR
ncbi:MAG TPA: hypothetical protein DCP06_02115 [Lachnospiraceae bacterium]|nr:hypothetical protein [Lachnospiraceae bacterium]